MHDNVFEYSKLLLPVLYVGIAQSLFATILIWARKPRNLSDKILSAWLFFIAIKLILNYFEITKSQYFLNKMGLLIVPLLFGPFLYLYVKSVAAEKPVFRRKEWIHFLPFVFFALYGGIFSYNKPVYNLHFFEHDGYLAERIIFGLAFYFSISVYTFLSIRILDRHRKAVKTHFSNLTQKTTLQWLLFVGIVFAVAYILVITSGIFNVFIFNKELIDPNLFSAIGLTLLSFAVSYYGYRQAPVGFTPSQDEPPLNNNVNTGPKYERSSLNEKDMDLYLEKLLKYMEEEKPWLNGELTIQDLSTKLNISKHHLTQVINTRLQKNFYNFVNEYRLREVKEKLMDPKYRKFKIISLAYDAGFNSKSSFNSVFKCNTGMTPSEFVKISGPEEKE